LLPPAELVDLPSFARGMFTIARLNAVTILDDAIIANACCTPFVAFGVNKACEEMTAGTSPSFWGEP